MKQKRHFRTWQDSDYISSSYKKHIGIELGKSLVIEDYPKKMKRI